MADNFQIPTFREKVITWNGASNTTYSYIVAASYKGILRLSPNDANSLVETGSANIDSVEYSDCDDPAITNQFIRVSTSDGYFVGLRINQTDIETDNLYVIGKAHHDLIRLYTSSKTAFRISRETFLPVIPNLDPAALVKSEEFIDQDITDIEVHNATEKSFLVISSNEQQRIFDWNQTAQIVKDYVRDAMLDIQALPTGSIHFCPISIHEYEKMLLNGYPNEFFARDGVTPNESIIRDFLVCDGSLYKNEDYPELAKILEGERIDYWKLDKEKNHMVRVDGYYNDYTEHKWFRVPDLRGRFLKSVLCSRDSVDLPGNQTGSFSNDSVPETTPDQTDQHTHFIASGFYQNCPRLGYTQNGYAEPYIPVAVDYDSGAQTPDKCGRLLQDDEQKVGVMSMHNQNQTKWPILYGDGYRRKAGPACTWQWCGDHGSAYFLSIPQDYNVKERNVTWVGASSLDMIACDINPANDKDLDYNGRDDYVPQIGTESEGSYAKEVLPEHYMALPLIKI